MRKIEQEMLKTIKALQEHHKKHYAARLEKSIGNTHVTCTRREDHTIVTSVYLHGNLIAQNGVTGWGFKMCGWPTPTTKSRINAIANAFGHAGVYTKKGKHYSGDKEVNAHDWF